MNRWSGAGDLRIAVAICTLRRPDSLARALRSIASAQPPSHARWQVVVVDNGDCASTREAVARFGGVLPISLLLEPNLGLARARNAAVDAVDCDYFIWTDDDVEVDAHWLRAYEAAFLAHPDAAFFGGPITPRFAGVPPRWLTDALPLVGTAYAELDLTGVATRFEPPSCLAPFGANMAVRAAEQRQHAYDVSLGRQPSRWVLSGEESDVFTRICAAGGFGLWVPEAKVTHWVDADRQSIAYLRRYYEGSWVGLTDARRRRGKVDGRSAATLTRGILRNELAYFIGRCLARPEVWARALQEASRLRALLAERSMAKQEKRARKRELRAQR